MRIAADFLVLTFLLAVVSPLFGAETQDLPELAAMYEADQAARSPENLSKTHKRNVLQEERDRRFAVFRLLSENRLQTANDFHRAAMILHHTGSMSTHSGNVTESLGTESHLLAFFLFRRAHELGHEPSRLLMAAAYNYYLHACHEDSQKFGYRFEDGKEIWRPEVSEEESEQPKCGFDPRPYFSAFDNQ